MKKISDRIVSSIAIIVLLLACTKQVGLVTEVEFDFLGGNTTEGYVNESLGTTLTVVPEEVLEGYTYNFRYSVVSGEGHFEDGNGEPLASGEKHAFDPLSKSLNYIGTTVGTHTVRIQAEDTYGFTEELELTYILSEVPVTWTATSADTELLLGAQTTITVTLGNEGVGNVTYERNYRTTTGSGELTESNGTGVDMDGYVDITPGTYQYDFTAETLGAVTFTFDLRDSNGQELTASVNLEVVEELSSGENDIIAFTLPEQNGTSLIDDQAHTVTVMVPEGTELTTAPNVLTVSEGATVAPVMDTQQDFTSPVIYTVTAENGDAQEWTVTVIEETTSTDPEITSFSINSVEGVITGNEITVVLPADTDVTALVPTIGFTGESVNPDSGSAQDFTSPVVYTVTEGVTSISFSVTVNVVTGSPIAIDDAFTVEENGVLNGNVLEDNGNGADVNAISVTQVNGSEGLVGQTVDGSNGGQLYITSDGAMGFYQSGEFDDLNAGETRQTTAIYQISDGNGGFDTATVTVTVTGIDDPNVAPSVFAGSNISITLPTDFVTLSGSATDSDGTIQSYLWEKQIGGAATITNPSSASTSVTGLEEGEYEFRLTAMDDDLASGSGTVTVTVNAAANVAPTAVATSNVTSGSAPLTVEFDNSGSLDPDGDIVLTNWDFGDGSPGNTGGFPTVVSHTFTDAGEYEVTLTVTDDGIPELNDTATMTITVTASNQQPTAVDDVYTVYENTTNNSLDVLDNDSDADVGDLLTITAIEDPINGTASIGTGQQTIIYDATTGSDRFDYTISDGNGGISTATIDVNVIPNESPTVEINELILIPSGNYPRTLDFQVASSNDDGSIVDYEWNFNDSGSAGNIINNTDDSSVSHTFNAAGTYNIVLTVTDNLGATGIDTVQIVLEEPLAPDFSFSANPYNPVPESGYSTNPIEIYFNISPNSAMEGGLYTMVMTTGKATINIDGNSFREGIEIPMTTGAVIGSFTDLLLNSEVTVTFTVTEGISGISKSRSLTLVYCTTACP